MKLTTIITLLAALCVTPFTWASDLAKEQRWAEQIVDALIDGEELWLNDGTNRFLGIYTENADGESSKAAIVMHGIGVHPDWPTVVQPLRVGLSESGWNTLSIQMPVLPNEAESDDYTAIFPEVTPRIEAAIHYLRNQRRAKTIVLIAHSLGSAMTSYYLSSGKRDVDGFIAIGLGPGGAGPVRDTAAQLARIGIPILDLYGEEDLPAVIRHAEAKRSAQSSNQHYTQIMVPGADHFFDGEESELLEQVNHWLRRYD